MDEGLISGQQRKGTYILVLHLHSPAHLAIGRLGTFDLPPGWYIYVGSAFGAGGLSGRLKHHLSPVARPHWHIDFLRAAAPLREIWFSDAGQHEHAWAGRLRSLAGAAIPAQRFGASDCRCVAHLVHFVNQPERVTVGEALSAALESWPCSSTL